MCIACDGYLMLLLVGMVVDWVHEGGQVGVVR